MAVAAALGLASAALHSSESGADLPEVAAKVAATKDKARKEVTEVVPGIVSPAPAAAAPAGSGGKENTDEEAKQSLLKDALEIIKKELPDYDESYHELVEAVWSKMGDSFDSPEYREAQKKEKEMNMYAARILPPHSKGKKNPDWCINVERGGKWRANIHPEISHGTVRVKVSDNLEVSHVEPYRIAELIQENETLEAQFDWENSELERKYRPDRYEDDDERMLDERRQLTERQKDQRAAQLGKYGTIRDTGRRLKTIDFP